MIVDEKTGVLHVLPQLAYRRTLYYRIPCSVKASSYHGIVMAWTPGPQPVPPEGPSRRSSRSLDLLLAFVHSTGLLALVGFLAFTRDTGLLFLGFPARGLARAASGVKIMCWHFGLSALLQ